MEVDKIETQDESQNNKAQGEPESVDETDPKSNTLTPLQEEAEKAEKYLNNWQRAEADLANYKKRSDQEKGELRRWGNASVIINLLPVYDDLERALSNLDSHLNGLTWVDGIRLISRKLQLLLEESGVSPIDTEGKDFDPHLHEAIQYTEGEDGKIIAEVQKGYKLHDRVIRPATVVVGKSDDTKNKTENIPAEGTVNQEEEEEND